MSTYDPLLAALLAHSPASDDELLLRRLLAEAPPSVAATLATRPHLSARPRAQRRLLWSAGALLLAGALTLADASAARAEPRMPEPPAAPARAQVAARPVAARVDMAVDSTALLPMAPAAIPSNIGATDARAALPPMVPSAMVQQPAAAQSAGQAPRAAAPAAITDPGSPIASQAAPTTAQPASTNSAFPAAQVTTPIPPKAQAVAVIPTTSQAAAAPARQVVVRERVRIVYIVIPPPDFSDPFVHIRGTAFDPNILAQGGPTVPPAAPARRVVVREVVVPAPARARTYVVRPGDTLTAIALRYYRNGDLWGRIYTANRAKIGGDPSELQAGLTLVIP